MTDAQNRAISQRMAARHSVRHDLQTRERIQTSQLVNRLRDCALGEIVMDAVQVRAAEILLNKTLPNLASVESFNQTEVSVISAEPMSPEAWAETHGADAGETRQ